MTSSTSQIPSDTPPPISPSDKSESSIFNISDVSITAQPLDYKLESVHLKASIEHLLKDLLVRDVGEIRAQVISLRERANEFQETVLRFVVKAEELGIWKEYFFDLRRLLCLACRNQDKIALSPSERLRGRRISLIAECLTIEDAMEELWRIKKEEGIKIFFRKGREDTFLKGCEYVDPFLGYRDSLVTNKERLLREIEEIEREPHDDEKEEQAFDIAFVNNTIQNVHDILTYFSRPADDSSAVQ
jgi:hypothetical protein